jgi:hypothetical protein
MLAHLVLATVAVPISSAILFFSLKPLLSVFMSSVALESDAPLTLPLFPLQAVLGLMTGLFLAVRAGEFGRDRTARYIWVVPAIWFLLFFASWQSRSVLVESRLEHFLWSTSLFSKRMQITTTMPSVTSLAYSLGSYMGSRTLKAHSSSSI